ncbi:hypothetical protein ACODUL_08170 [Stenotrophomonas maltophilia]
MSQRSNEKLLERYLEYASSEEAFAVLFVKRYLPEARGYWIDPEDFRRYEKSSNNLHFRYVIGALYRRLELPKYPSKVEFIINGVFNERRYLTICRAITWEAAHRDMDQQRSSGIRGSKFEVTGVSYDRNRGSAGFFRDDAPPEIKALATNLQDRTDPLWDRALQYANAPEFVFEVRRARVFGALPGKMKNGSVAR